MKQILGVGSLLLAGLTACASEVTDLTKVCTTNCAVVVRTTTDTCTNALMQTTKMMFSLHAPSSYTQPIIDVSKSVISPNATYNRFSVESLSRRYGLSLFEKPVTQNAAIAGMLKELDLTFASQLVEGKVNNPVYDQQQRGYDSLSFRQEFNLDPLDIVQRGIQYKLWNGGLFDSAQVIGNVDGTLKFTFTRTINTHWQLTGGARANVLRDQPDVRAYLQLATNF